MSYTVFVVHSAMPDIQILPRIHIEAYIAWMQNKLGNNPAEAGVRLTGTLSGLYSLSRPGRLQVVYGIDEGRKHVLIILVIPGSISITQKKAELIKRFKAVKATVPPAGTPIGNWTDFTS